MLLVEHPQREQQPVRDLRARREPLIPRGPRRAAGPLGRPCWSWARRSGATASARPRPSPAGTPRRRRRRTGRARAGSRRRDRRERLPRCGSRSWARRSRRRRARRCRRVGRAGTSVRACARGERGTPPRAAPMQQRSRASPGRRAVRRTAGWSADAVDERHGALRSVRLHSTSPLSAPALDARSDGSLSDHASRSAASAELAAAGERSSIASRSRALRLSSTSPCAAACSASASARSTGVRCDRDPQRPDERVRSRRTTVATSQARRVRAGAAPPNARPPSRLGRDPPRHRRARNGGAELRAASRDRSRRLSAATARPRRPRDLARDAPRRPAAAASGSPRELARDLGRPGCVALSASARQARTSRALEHVVEPTIAARPRPSLTGATSSRTL